MYIVLHVKYPLLWSGFNKTWILSTDFRKIFQYQISCKSAHWKPSCSKGTDMTKLIVGFRNFANAPKMPMKLEALSRTSGSWVENSLMLCLCVWFPVSTETFSLNTVACKRSYKSSNRAGRCFLTWKTPSVDILATHGLITKLLHLLRITTDNFESSN